MIRAEWENITRKGDAMDGTSWGWSLLTGGRFLFRAWKYRLKLDPAEIAFVRSVLRPDDVCFDIGAHKGSYSYWMRASVGPGGAVHCFEPQIHLAEYQRHQWRRWGVRNVQVEAAAVSSAAGVGTLVRRRNGPCICATLEFGGQPNETERTVVPTVSLDDYIEERGINKIRLVKIDVEGHELDVFQGARRLLTNLRPILLFECESRHLRRYCQRDVFDLLEQFGYQGYFFEGRRKRRVEDYEPDQHGRFGSPGYVNNFVFEPLVAIPTPHWSQPSVPAIAKAAA